MIKKFIFYSTAAPSRKGSIPLVKLTLVERINSIKADSKRKESISPVKLTLVN